MRNIDIIQTSIDYIEENLKTEISANELSKISGFSLFHYYRIFQDIIGIPVMQYVLRRKLINAIYEISLGSKIIDTALIFGFETHAGFFKAFVREYDCSPTLYLKNHTVRTPYKINLLQKENIMITQKKIKEILANWNLSNAKISPLYYESTGEKSDNEWIINSKYVLRVSTNLGEFLKHFTIAKALSKSGIDASVPVLSNTNEPKKYIQDGELYFCLLNKVEGSCIKASENYIGEYKTKARYVGEIIGQLHNVLQKYDSEFICDEPNIFEDAKNWSIPETRKLINLPQSFYSNYLGVFGKLYPQLPKHVIHRNLTPSDIIYKDNRFSGFVDFHLSERNIRIFDPCYASTGILSESFVENDMSKLDKWIEVYKNIITGYDSVCKLSSEEKQSIPYVIFTIQMICFTFFSSTPKYKELAEMNKKMLLWLASNQDKLEIL